MRICFFNRSFISQQKQFLEVPYKRKRAGSYNPAPEVMSAILDRLVIYYFLSFSGQKEMQKAVIVRLPVPVQELLIN